MSETVEKRRGVSVGVGASLGCALMAVSVWARSAGGAKARSWSYRDRPRECERRFSGLGRARAAQRARRATPLAEIDVDHPGARPARTRTRRRAVRDQLRRDRHPLLGDEDANRAETTGTHGIHLEALVLEQARDALVLEESFDEVRFGLECRGVADFPR